VDNGRTQNGGGLLLKRKLTEPGGSGEDSIYLYIGTCQSI